MNNYKKAVENIVNACLSLKKPDKLIIVSDYARRNIGEAIYKKAKTIANSKLLFIEDFIDRPAEILPADLIYEIKEFKPTASVYAATGQEGELQNFRSPLTDILLNELKLRHAHMININKEIMLDGMSKDYKQIQKAVAKLYKILKKADTIKVTDKNGSDFEVKLTTKHKWRKDDGLLNKPGKWNNLPAGEVFTAPESLEGKIVAWEIGDYFSEKYGLLRSPITIEVENSRINNITGKNKKLVEELKEYITTDKNSNRAGEIGIGCLLGLDKLIGNLLQDEKFPGVHIAFGSPYPERTGAGWDSTTHVDVIPLDVNITVDGEQIMEKGDFIINF